ncbi:MAG: methyltransferase domain-containing protein [Bdellovibrionia bacterium]
MKYAFHMERDHLGDVQEYYETGDEAARRNRHQLEFAVTFQILEKHLKPKGNVLELGAGPGTYTLFLASKGHKVTALDLSMKLVEENRATICNAGFENSVTHVHGDARDVLNLTQEKFDHILIMGPMYHLIKYSERRALLEAVGARLAPGGTVLSSFLSRAGFFGYMVTQHPEWLALSEGQFSSILKKGIIKDHPRNGAFRGHFCTLEEIHGLHRDCGYEVTALHSQDPGIGGNDDAFNRLPGPNKEDWARALFQISDDPLALGSGRTIMAIAKPLVQS